MGLDLTGLGSVFDFAGEVIERILPKKATELEKIKATQELQELLQKREADVDSYKRDIIVTELQQKDRFTKRARPSIIYTGLASIVLVHVLLPIVAYIVLLSTGKPLTNMPDVALPTAFWATYGSVCSVYAVGRTAEKFGIDNKLTALITGGK